MTKDEYGQLLKEIAGGGDEVGAEAGRLRAECEAQVLEKILTTYWALIVSGDAIHQFYMDLLRFYGKRLEKASPLVIWFFIGMFSHRRGISPPSTFLNVAITSNHRRLLELYGRLR